MDLIIILLYFLCFICLINYCHVYFYRWCAVISKGNIFFTKEGDQFFKFQKSDFRGKLLMHRHHIFTKQTQHVHRARWVSHHNFKQNRHGTDMDTTDMEAYLGDVLHHPGTPYPTFPCP